MDKYNLREFAGISSLSVVNQWSTNRSEYRRNGRPSTPRGENACDSNSCWLLNVSVWLFKTSDLIHEKLSGLLGSRSLMDGLLVSSESSKSALSIRSRRCNGVGFVKTHGTLGWREINSASTRLIMEAQAGMSVTYSGPPIDPKKIHLC